MAFHTARSTAIPDAATLAGLASFANQVVDASGEIIRAHASLLPGNGLAFENKTDFSPVTAVDRAVEREIRNRIAASYPQHGILGEEMEATDLDRDLVWVVDPIDGTKPFIGGIPVYGTLLALTWQGTPILGIIDHPYTRERWVGIDGIGTFFNGTRVTARQRASLSEAVMFTGNPEPFVGSERGAFDRLRAEVNFAVYGANCYGYGCLANGRMDIGIESGHDPFDFCALAPVVTNAGGRISDWEGRPLTIRSGKRYLASGDRRLHDVALALLMA